ncbi:PAS domain-containing protein [Methylobacterium sp. Leaf123]|uniref:PAS domain-containing protein n=1 Tax=Methylobacterium sp. Leaf123 TaxID=1736264 RepID=UPI00138F2204|nr:PAS domain-containing protein [Methylobacterium sp. Leaf123]
MAERIRAFEWARTPLGPIEGWPQSLKTVVEMMLGAPHIGGIAWGPDLNLLYNDHYHEILRAIDPAPLGRPFLDCWPAPEGRQIADLLLQGQARQTTDRYWDLFSRPERPFGWYTASWTPLRDEAGRIAGFYLAAFETTDRVLAERALRESEEHLRHTVESNPQISWTASPDGTIDFAPARFHEWTGVSGLGETWTAVQHPEDVDRIVEHWMRCVRTGEPSDIQHRVRMRDSQFRWMRSRAVPRRDATGRIVRWYGTSEDIHEYKLADLALREREEQQAFLLRLSDALRPLTDPAAIQGEACRMLGEHLKVDYAYYVELYEAQGIAIIRQDYVSGERLSLIGTYPVSLIEWGIPLYKQGRPIAFADATTSPLVPEAYRSAVARGLLVAWIGIPLLKHGELVGALSVSMVTPRAWTETEIALARETGERIWAAIERGRAERTAREADIRLRTMADAAPVLIWDVDASGTLFVNNHYLDFFGITFDAVSKRGWEQFLHPDDAAAHIAAFEEAYAQRRPFTHEARVRRSDGQYRWLSSSGQPLGKDRFVGVAIDVTERRQAEERVRRNNAVLQAINLVFSETLGASSEEELARISLEVAEELTGSAIGFMGEIDETTGRLDGLFFSDRSRARYAANAPEGRSNLPPGKQALGLEAHGIYGQVLRDGRGLIVNEPASHPDRVGTPADHLPLTAFLGVPLKQGEKTRGMIGLGNREGGYRTEDLDAVEALAPAIWHALRSKRAELRLRESEERFRQFAEASSDVLWIRDAETLEMEYVSPALSKVYGLEPSVLGKDVRVWGGHMIPDDRARAFGNLRRAGAGESLVNEFRIQRPSDGAFRWIRSTLFPLRDEQGRVRRIGGLSSDMTEAKLLTGHQSVLLAELQHRVRNIMAVTRSIVARTGERAESVADYASLVGGRLLTLARVQALLTRSPNAGVPVATIVHDEIDAQALRADQYDLAGPKVELSPKAAEILTLAVHELATNALKYGALSVPEGRVRVRWSLFEKQGESWLGFDWVEDGVPDAKIADERRANCRTNPHGGFGRELIEGRLPYELGGRGRLEIGSEGARCRLEFPLRDSASILETDAPQRATVFGGALDMTGEPDLSGYRILVVEDDYYLATDTARALQGAGAEVVGPCPSEEAAREALDEGAPAAALVDINLGSGPSFTLAALLRERGVPFVFITGYDEGVIPPDFADVERLQKPVELKRVVHFLADALHAAP